MSGLFGNLKRRNAGSTAMPPDAVAAVEPEATTAIPSMEMEKNAIRPDIAIEQDRKELEEDLADLPPDLIGIPPVVRKTVSLEDDPSLPTITFRYFVLTIFFIAPGAFLSQMSNYRTTYSPYSVFFVQIACHYAGKWLAHILPAWEFKVPFTRYSFNTNPGPWSIKEHVLVTISANSGAIGNLAWTPISLAQLYYGDKIPAAVCLFFMWAIVWLGYSLAVLARQFLLYDPLYQWPQSLMQANLFETFRKSSEDSKVGRKQKHVFFWLVLGVTLWQFLPEFVFPFLSSLSFLCWVAPRNPIANFMGAGLGGMGFLNFSLDWSTISTQWGNPLINPFWVSVVLFAAYVLNCWILLPAAKWGNLGEWHHQLMSNRLFLANGTRYPVTTLIGPNHTLNQTAYEQLGPLHMGTQELWSLFFDYASYTSAFTWCLLFGSPQIKTTVRKLIERIKSRGKVGVNTQFNDRLNVIMRSYKEVPMWWYITLFMCHFVIIITILSCGYFYIPIWTYFIALLTGFVVVVPMSWLFAISNFQVAIGSFNELLYGYMVNAGSGHRHPAGASTYGSIAGDAWYRAQYMLQDQKIGHYMHIPPRDVFFSQIFGCLIGVPINYGVIQWILESKGDYLLGNKEDPLHQWTGQSLSNSNTLAVQYVLVGPARLFKLHMFKPLPYGFLFGAGSPFILYALHCLFPRAKLQLWNVTIFCSAMSFFYGNISTGNTSRFIVAFIMMYWLYHYRQSLWAKYNYIIAAAADAGFNFNLLLIFLCFGSGKQISMPNWWGNNAESVERCFALNDS